MAEDLRIWYRAIRNVVGIHLGLADRLLLKNYLLNYLDIGAIGRISNVLYRFGYRSKRLTEILEKKRKSEQSSLEIWVKAHNQLKNRV